MCVRNRTQTHIHIHTSTSHTKAGPARGRFNRATCPCVCVPAPPGAFYLVGRGERSTPGLRLFLRLLSRSRFSCGFVSAWVWVDGCEVRPCDPCARVRPCVPCVPCVSRLPPVSFYRYPVAGTVYRTGFVARDVRDTRARARASGFADASGPVDRLAIIQHSCWIPLLCYITTATRPRALRLLGQCTLASRISRPEDTVKVFFHAHRCSL